MSSTRRGIRVHPNSFERAGLKKREVFSDRVTLQPGTFDFAVDGGVIGDVNLGMGLIPANARIVRLSYRTGADVTSGGAATIEFMVKDSDGADVLSLRAATLVSDASFGAAQNVDTANGDVATWLGPVASAGQIFVRIAAFDLTAGDFEVFCDYVIGE